jgi:hypothetical protein
MKDSSSRYAAPLDVVRPRRARLLEAFSLKLNRRIRLFDRASFDQWVQLEAEPQVLSLCERPTRLGPAPDARLIDFWVLRRDSEQLLLIDDDEPVPPMFEGMPVRQVTAAELAASAMWIANWQRMLPVITMCLGLLPTGLTRSVLSLAREPAALSRIEHEQFLQRIVATGQAPPRVFQVLKCLHQFQLVERLRVGVLDHAREPMSISRVALLSHNLAPYSCNRPVGHPSRRGARPAHTAGRHIARSCRRPGSLEPQRRPFHGPCCGVPRRLQVARPRSCSWRSS